MIKPVIHEMEIYTSDKILINGIILLVLAIVLIIVVTLYQSRKEVATLKLVDETQQALLNTEKIYLRQGSQKPVPGLICFPGTLIFLIPI